MRIVGYTDQWGVRPGQSVGLHVSCRSESFHASVVRLRHGDTNPAGPGFRATSVPSCIDGRYKAQWHDVPAGSFACVDEPDQLLNSSAATLAVWICPTAPGGAQQTIVSREAAGFSLFLDADGRAGISVGSARASVTSALLAHHWYMLVVRLDRSARAAELHVLARDRWPGFPGVDGASMELGAIGTWQGPLLIAAQATVGGTASHFNGKIDSPAIYDTWLSDEAVTALFSGVFLLEPVAAWDFSADHASLEIPDRAGGHTARLVGMPTRAVTGRRWTDGGLSPAEQPRHYTAIHFHDDDRDDAGWPEVLRLPIPDSLASGIYAFHVQTEKGDEDYIPFFILPARAGPYSSVAFLAPTFSYLAYGNAHVEDRFLKDPTLGLAFPDAARLYPSQEQDRYILEQGLHSSYDLHSDGSGVAYVSRLLPQVHFRPKVHFQFLRSLQGSPHQFNADLHLVDWLTEKSFDHDVITDEALHLEGVDLLTPYQVIVTGTHPEYWSGAMLDALQAYLNDGGRVMYLGGNGFFWVTSMHPSAPHVLEIRKWGGTRAWDALPGERHHSTTGELGGLWRNRGRPPQKLVGVGFTAQGMDINAAYRRTEESYGELGFLFDGITGDVFGDVPSLVMEHGAAGFEIDRIDPALGSPPATTCLARSFGHSKSYRLAVEELLATHAGTGPENPLVRADIAYVSYPGGGAVFSTGSISYCGCLSYNNYDNDVSRLTENVLRHFLNSS
ncbi:MAG TPA: N,N-dimethylformamidase beta subunit family domain-containing protein [Pedomonas sp.]|uniref:N,N-dimethylformamidase beta subunit family domain-containing protein n=1 Tax=Pedomonas sp. TaxID=2976421 RepID=UPI002F401148